MLSFGSPERLRIETVDPNDLLEGAVRLVRSETEGPVHIDFSSEAPSFPADRIKLRQAIRNLVANALQAQGCDGHVSISLKLEQNEIRIRVTDAGPGIPAEHRVRVLDPFFTTKPDGTGLGLPLVAVIAQLHGGELELSPAPSSLGGAEFLIRFPFRPLASAASGLPQAPGQN
jgi:two-component system sensor histidine kinase AtoS